LTNEKQLMACDTREQAAELINKMNRKELLALADELYVYVEKRYDDERIINKIVDATVGVKLMRKAIASIPLK
jgi:hypothetical protein